MLRISGYATASTDSAAYIIGGYVEQFASRLPRVSTIAEYKNNSWQAIGNLNQPKESLSAISYRGEYIFVGGYVPAGETPDENR